MSNQNGQQNSGSPTKVLVFSIIGLALCESGILGLIFSIIGLVQAKKYVAQYGDVSNQVRIARRLAIAGLILSIVCIVIYVIAIVVSSAAISAAAS